ncbi:hypothetical protein QBC46DRAFT_424293 [Diplogelasinospora grovesii]|uniref:Uncharacterized protein n=1 Tax=Diplogelasinospora grovesii TaxID=303347 RepID=A0AAN6RYX7_9PEZI|nr:hypothetical protein QBC46DRAFT_424293 [Diplogelasinospora grovesii]
MEPFVHLREYPFVISNKVSSYLPNDRRRISEAVRWIQEHCWKAHGWRNEWQKGGNVAKKAKEAREVPWTAGILCQRGWFKVGRDSTAVEMIEQRKKQLVQLRRVDRLRSSVMLIGDKEPSFKRVMEQARAAAVAGRINRKEAHVKPSKPFNSRVKDDTWERYKEVCRKLFSEMVKEAGMVDRLYLDIIVTFLDHPFKDSYYESAIISGLADYTPVYSVAVLEREDEIIEKKKTMSEEEARVAAPGLFRLVRGKVRRFITIVTDTSEPAPMDWMFNARMYGMRIWFITPAGDRVTIGALADMVHELIREMKGVLGGLLIIKEEDFSAVPAIEWKQFKDDHSEDRDDRNAWVAKGHGADKQAEWVAGAANGAIPYRADAVRGYGRAVERFREGMLVVMHMEVIEMRHSNTAYGGVRNIMIDRGMVCFVTLYHKNYRSSEQVKVIHQYLPREAGELQQVQGIIKGANEPSAFLWAEEIVKKGEAQEGEADGISVKGEEGEEGEEDEEAAKEEGQAAWVRERKYIAIAISNQYLNKAFGQGRDEGDEYDKDDKAGHSSHVAGMQGAFRTAERRDKFRGEDSCKVRVIKCKRKADVFKSVREEARFRRFAWLRTGGGKSMLFILPAFYSPDRVTVIIVPLVALREDLHARC